jgi:TonB family protein
MRLTLLESDRRVIQTAEFAAISIIAHTLVVWGAVTMTDGGRVLPNDAREARVFFLLPPDRVDARSRQLDVPQWGKLGSDIEDGKNATADAAGWLLRPQATGRRGSAEKAGARGQLPAGVQLAPADTIFSVLEVDSTVERYDGSAAPAYPPNLLALGTEGIVYAQFVVDTSGAVDTTSIRVLSSAHPEFEQSVRTALRAMRFRPAKRGSHRVRQLVEQHFRFTITSTAQVADNKRVT